MSEIIPNEEFIKKNYDKTVELIRKVYNSGDEKVFVPPLLRMIEDLGLRYATSPASSHKNYYSAFPGGLCYHNLHVLQWIGRFASLLAPKEFSNESMLKVSILSEIGKIGDLENDLYIPTTDDWKRRNGQHYDVNNTIQYMRTNQRSLYLAAHYGISLTQNEYLAILLSEGQHEDANSLYRYKEPKLGLILQYANQWSQRIEKQNTIIWP